MVTPSNQPPIGKPVLDAFKKQVILRVIIEGGTRRAAARIVGCAASTVTRTAHRDLQFGFDLAQAEEMFALNALRTLNRVASQDKYWRAAAWIMERLDPRFTRHTQNLLTIDQVRELFHLMMKSLAPDLSLEQRRRVCANLSEQVRQRKEGSAPIVVDELLADLEASMEQPDPTAEPTADPVVEPSWLKPYRQAAAARAQAEPAAPAPMPEAPPPPASESSAEASVPPASQPGPSAAAPAKPPETAPEPPPAPEKPRQARPDEEAGEGPVQHTPPNG